MDKPYIFVCSAYEGKPDNYQKALKFGQHVIRKGGIPIIPHTMLHGVIDESIPEHRLSALHLKRKLIKMCSAVWVFGKSEGIPDMITELDFAKDEGIPISYINITDVWGADEKTIALKKCIQRYEEIYITFNRIIMDDMVYYLDAGIEPDLICECINISARKGARWPYAKAILQRCLRSGYLTIADFKVAQNNKRPQNSFAAYDIELFEKMLKKD